jgi:hypothetical protein
VNRLRIEHSDLRSCDTGNWPCRRTDCCFNLAIAVTTEAPLASWCLLVFWRQTDGEATHEEIAAELGCTRARIGQVEEEILASARDPELARRLIDYVRNQ